MAIKFNTTNGSITLDAADGTGNVDLSIPREGIQAIDANLAKYDAVTANFTGTLQNAGANVVVDTDIGSTVQAFDATILKDADIGTTVQGYDANTAKLNLDQSFTGKQSFSNTTSIQQGIEKFVTDSSTTGTLNINFLDGAVIWCNANQTGNRTINIRGDATTTLISQLNDGDSITFTVLLKMGGTGYYVPNIQTDGVNRNIAWSGGSAPDSGNANSIDAYTITVFRFFGANSGEIQIYASLTQFA